MYWDKIKEFFEKNKKVFIWIGVGIALLVLLGAGIRDVYKRQRKYV